VSSISLYCMPESGGGRGVCAGSRGKDIKDSKDYKDEPLGAGFLVLGVPYVRARSPGKDRIAPGYEYKMLRSR
jgi:hypothetical protein